jgi:hypothetical protein
MRHYPHTIHLTLEKKPLETMINSLKLDDALKQQVSEVLERVSAPYQEPSFFGHLTSLFGPTPTTTFFGPSPLKATINEAISQINHMIANQPANSTNAEKLGKIISYLKQPQNKIIGKKEVYEPRDFGPGRDD